MMMRLLSAGRPVKSYTRRSGACMYRAAVGYNVNNEMEWKDMDQQQQQQRHHKQNTFDFTTICCYQICIAGLVAVLLSDNSNNDSKLSIRDQSVVPINKLSSVPINKLSVDGINKFSSIIVGGGTSGCTTAYILAKWMDDNKVPGHVLLIDRGVSFNTKAGPSPRLALWYENWCEFGEAHESKTTTGDAYPVVPSDHKGLGGCSTHDTRITFQLRDEQQRRMAQLMGWSHDRLCTYFQAALNLMPLSPSISNQKPIPFYEAVVETLTRDSDSHGHVDVDKDVDVIHPGLHALPDNEHQAKVTVNTIARSSLAMYEDVNNEDDVRWTAAYLMQDPFKPKSLKIITNATVDSIVFNGSEEDKKKDLLATGVKIIIGDETYIATIDRFIEGSSSSNNSDDDNIYRIGEIAITSGAINSSAVLQRSGVGPKELLDSFGIPSVVNNPYVGHGIDHEEIAILYEWLDKWSCDDGSLPKGGAMGWPIVLFASFLKDKATDGSSEELLSEFFEAHFGAGYAEPYTSFPSVVVTPSCIRPDHSSLDTGFQVKIKSLDPTSSCLLIQGNHAKDVETMALGMLSVSHLFQPLIDREVIGKQLEPPFEISQGNKDKLIEWIKSNHYTVFHWSCTCQAGLKGRVCDEKFRVRRNYKAIIDDGLNNNNNNDDNDDSSSIISNLRVGSAASLPELSEANPHLTITAFAIALAEELARSLAVKHNVSYHPPKEISRAYDDIHAVNNISNDAEVPIVTNIRRQNEEVPALGNFAREYSRQWDMEHSKAEP